MSSQKDKPPFEVDASGMIRAELRRIQRRAAEVGQGDQVVAAIQRIVGRLEQTPQEFGEAVYRLPMMRMGIRCAVVYPLAVTFGVCEDRPMVYLKIVRWLTEPTS